MKKVEAITSEDVVASIKSKSFANKAKKIITIITFANKTNIVDCNLSLST